MHSSTFNSEFPQHRAPAMKWRLIWAASLFVTAIIFGVAELFWRSQGHRPTVVDSQALWAYHRSCLTGDGLEVACIGTSRMACGFATEAFYQRFAGTNLRQLAVHGTQPIAALRDLAEDERFRGVVICDLQDTGFLTTAWHDQSAYVRYYHEEFGISQLLDCLVLVNIEGRFSTLNPQIRLDSVIHSVLADRKLPLPRFQMTRSDRWRTEDLRQVDDIARIRREIFVEESRKAAASVQTPPDEWFKDVVEVEKFVQQIQSRGGKVVFVRFPTDGAKWEYDQRAFPRDKYWDRMAEFTAAETIHFADFPALTQFELQDASHLNSTDATVFTNALLDILESRGTFHGKN